MIIWWILSLFGLLITHRTLSSCETLQLFSNKQLINIRHFSFLTVIVMNFVLRKNLLLLGGWNIVIFLSPWWLAHIIQSRREMILKREIVPILDSLILSMKSGRAFRPSLMSYVEKSTTAVKVTMQDFLSSLQYRKNIRQLSSDLQISFFLLELAEIDQASQRPIDRLKALRRRIYLENNFRRKSRQALLQVKVQSWILTTMYFFLTLFVHFQFDLNKHRVLAINSFALFMFGFLVLRRIGRNYRWKL